MKTTGVSYTIHKDIIIDAKGVAIYASNVYGIK